MKHNLLPALILTTSLTPVMALSQDGGQTVSVPSLTAVRLETIRSRDEDLLRDLAAAMQQRYPNLLLGSQIQFTRVETFGTVFYRMDIQDVANEDVARQLCQVLEMEQCLVARPGVSVLAGEAMAIAPDGLVDMSQPVEMAAMSEGMEEAIGSVSGTQMADAQDVVRDILTRLPTTRPQKGERPQFPENMMVASAPVGALESEGVAVGSDAQEFFGPHLPLKTAEISDPLSDISIAVSNARAKAPAQPSLVLTNQSQQRPVLEAVSPNAPVVSVALANDTTGEVVNIAAPVKEEGEIVAIIEEARTQPALLRPPVKPSLEGETVIASVPQASQEVALESASAKDFAQSASLPAPQSQKFHDPRFPKASEKLAHTTRIFANHIESVENDAPHAKHAQSARLSGVLEAAPASASEIQAARLALGTLIYPSLSQAPMVVFGDVVAKLDEAQPVKDAPSQRLDSRVVENKAALLDPQKSIALAQTMTIDMAKGRVADIVAQKNRAPSSRDALHNNMETSDARRDELRLIDLARLSSRPAPRPSWIGSDEGRFASDPRFSTLVYALDQDNKARMTKADEVLKAAAQSVFKAPAFALQMQEAIDLDRVETAFVEKRDSKSAQFSSPKMMAGVDVQDDLAFVSPRLALQPELMDAKASSQTALASVVQANTAIETTAFAPQLTRSQAPLMPKLSLNAPIQTAFVLPRVLSKDIELAQAELAQDASIASAARFIFGQDVKTVAANETVSLDGLMVSGIDGESVKTTTGEGARLAQDFAVAKTDIGRTEIALTKVNVVPEQDVKMALTATQSDIIDIASSAPMDKVEIARLDTNQNDNVHEGIASALPAKDVVAEIASTTRSVAPQNVDLDAPLMIAALQNPGRDDIETMPSQESMTIASMQSPITKTIASPRLVALKNDAKSPLLIGEEVRLADAGAVDAITPNAALAHESHETVIGRNGTPLHFSSSKKIDRVLAQAETLFPVRTASALTAHVETALSPTDAPSRVSAQMIAALEGGMADTISLDSARLASVEALDFVSYTPKPVLHERQAPSSKIKPILAQASSSLVLASLMPAFVNDIESSPMTRVGLDKGTEFVKSGSIEKNDAVVLASISHEDPNIIIPSIDSPAQSVLAPQVQVAKKHRNEAFTIASIDSFVASKTKISSSHQSVDGIEVASLRGSPAEILVGETPRAALSKSDVKDRVESEFLAVAHDMRQSPRMASLDVSEKVPSKVSSSLRTDQKPSVVASALMSASPKALSVLEPVKLASLGGLQDQAKTIVPLMQEYARMNEASSLEHIDMPAQRVAQITPAEVKESTAFSHALPLDSEIASKTGAMMQASVVDTGRVVDKIDFDPITVAYIRSPLLQAARLDTTPAKTLRTAFVADIERDYPTLGPIDFSVPAYAMSERDAPAPARVVLASAASPIDITQSWFASRDAKKVVSRDSSPAIRLDPIRTARSVQSIDVSEPSSESASKALASLLARAPDTKVAPIARPQKEIVATLVAGDIEAQEQTIPEPEVKKAVAMRPVSVLDRERSDLTQKPKDARPIADFMVAMGTDMPLSDEQLAQIDAGPKVWGETARAGDIVSYRDEPKIDVALAPQAQFKRLDKPSSSVMTLAQYRDILSSPETTIASPAIRDFDAEREATAAEQALLAEVAREEQERLAAEQAALEERVAQAKSMNAKLAEKMLSSPRPSAQSLPLTVTATVTEEGLVMRSSEGRKVLAPRAPSLPSRFAIAMNDTYAMPFDLSGSGRLPLQRTPTLRPSILEPGEKAPVAVMVAGDSETDMSAFFPDASMQATAPVEEPQDMLSVLQEGLDGAFESLDIDSPSESIVEESASLVRPVQEEPASSRPALALPPLLVETRPQAAEPLVEEEPAQAVQEQIDQATLEAATEPFEGDVLKDLEDSMVRGPQMRPVAPVMNPMNNPVPFAPSEELVMTPRPGSILEKDTRRVAPRERNDALMIRLSYATSPEDATQRVQDLMRNFPRSMLEKGSFFGLPAPASPGLYIIGIQAHNEIDRQDLVGYMDNNGIPYVLTGQSAAPLLQQ